MSPLAPGLNQLGLRPLNLPLLDLLGQWVGWTDTIALSAALGTAPAAPPAGGPLDPARWALELQALDHALTTASREGQQQAHRDVEALNRELWALAAGPTLDDGPHWRRLHGQLQSRWSQAVAGRRADVRRVARSGPQRVRRLAELDEVLERALQERQQRALAQFAGLWEQGWRQALRAGHAGHTLFLDTAQDLLQLEWDIRWQPVLGLRSALDLTKEDKA